MSFAGPRPIIEEREIPARLARIFSPGYLLMGGRDERAYLA